MAGFCLKILRRPATVPCPEFRLVDLGVPDKWDGIDFGGAQCAWSGRRVARQLRIEHSPRRFFFLDGQPDRFPEPDEPAESWLDGRWGTFRGFELRFRPEDPEFPRVTVFCDPLASRPVFVLPDTDGVLVADKLSTIALNAAGRPEVDWEVLLEAAALGTVYSEGVTLKGARMLSPGEMSVFERGECKHSTRHPMPADADVDPARVERDAPGSLLDALRKAVSETWTSETASLLLSGGLDSRTVLALAGSGRKVTTVTGRDSAESRLARRIAEACEAEFLLVLREPAHYPEVVRHSFLLTGAMWDPTNAHHLGFGPKWRAGGREGVVHAYQFDATIKGNRILPRQKYPSPQVPLYAVAGPRAIYLSGLWSTRHARLAPDDLLKLVSPPGLELLSQRLQSTTGALDPVIEGGLDVTVERFLNRRMTTGPSYPAALAWFEEQDVCSPIYHPAVWSWYRHSDPRDRYLGRAFRKALLRFNHPAMRVPDSNTGRAIAGVPWWRDFQDILRNQPLYAAVRRLYRSLRPPHDGIVPGRPDDSSWPPHWPLFRTRSGREVLEEGLEMMASCEHFDGAAIRTAARQFESGADSVLEMLLVLSAAGRWVNLVEHGAGFRHPAVMGVRPRRGAGFTKTGNEQPPVVT